MLRHVSARSAKRVFSIRWGTMDRDIVVCADSDGILRQAPERGQPLESGIPIDQANPEAADRLVSLYAAQIIDERPKPVAEADEEPVPVSVTPPATRVKSAKGSDA